MERKREREKEKERERDDAFACEPDQRTQEAALEAVATEGRKKDAAVAPIRRLDGEYALETMEA